MSSSSNVLVLGDDNSGVSSLSAVLSGQAFTTERHPSTRQLAKDTMILGEHNLTLHLLGLGSSQRFRYWMGEPAGDYDITMVLYDITNRHSFGIATLRVNMWTNSEKTDAVILLVGTKLDLSEQREVSTEEGADKASSRGARFIEVSAKTGENVGVLKELLIKIAAAPMCKVMFIEQQLDATDLLKAFLSENFQNASPWLLSPMTGKVVYVEKLNARLVLWTNRCDYSLKPRYEADIRSRRADVIVFDLSDTQMFRKVGEHFLIRTIDNNVNWPIFLVGYQRKPTDRRLETHRKVRFEEGVQMSNRLGAMYTEIMATTDINLRILFTAIITCCVASVQPPSQ